MLRGLFRGFLDDQRNTAILQFKKQLAADTGCDFLNGPLHPLDDYMFQYFRSEIRKCPGCNERTEGIFRCAQCNTLKPSEPLRALLAANVELHLLTMGAKDKPAAEEAIKRTRLIDEILDPVDK